MRIKRISFAICLLFVIFILFSNLGVNVLGANSAPKITKFTVTPRRGIPETDFLFTATYTDLDNDAPSGLSVFVDQIEYEMEEVDPQDTNYTDGKDYFLKQVLGKGTYTFYYRTDDGKGNEVTTGTYTLDVSWEVGHYDLIHYFEDEVLPGVTLILAMFIILVIVLCVILVLIMIQLRKIGKVLGRESSDKKPDIPKKEED
jgi:hypothetical protein